MYQKKQMFLVGNGVWCKWVSWSDGAVVDSSEESGAVYQILVPVSCRQHLLELDHKHLVLSFRSP